MVLPLADDNSDRRSIPWVNYALIAINVFVFVVLQNFGTNDKFTYAFSCVPKEIVTGQDITTSSVEYVDPETGKPSIDPETNQPVLKPGLEQTPITPYITLLTSIFMHGSIMHIVGNMLFLWIFGDNIEDVLGHGRYIVFYLLCGLIASLSHIAATYATGADPEVPSLGASGAISGVLGGYLLLFPTKRVTVLLFRFITQVPAYVAIGMWFVFQIINALVAMGSTGSGVAYGAHVGGFIAGLALVKVFAIGRDLTRFTPRHLADAAAHLLTCLRAGSVSDGNQEPSLTLPARPFHNNRSMTASATNFPSRVSRTMAPSSASNPSSTCRAIAGPASGSRSKSVCSRNAARSMPMQRRNCTAIVSRARSASGSSSL